VESTAQQPCNFMDIAMWPLSCLQCYSPALARPAVYRTVAATVRILAATSALSVLCC
jgi:hypothetical protein